MTLPTSGPISFRDIANEFSGGSDPIGLNEYYRGGAYVPVGTATGVGAFFQTPATSVQIPLSGPIQLSQFYGTQRAFVFNDFIHIDFTNGYSLVSRAIDAGWDQVAPLIASVTIDSGILVTGVLGDYAFTTFKAGGYPSGSQVQILNHGNIIGAGGDSGHGGYITSTGSGKTLVATFHDGVAGTNGSPGIFFDPTITTYMYNFGTIGGGGGGGGGGAAALSFNSPTAYSAGSGGGGGQGAADRFSGLGTHAGIGGVSTGTYFQNADGANGTLAPTPGTGNWRVSPSIYTYGAGGAGGLIPSWVRGGTGGAGGEVGQWGFPGGAGDYQSQDPAGQSAFGAGGAAGQAIVNSGVPQWGDYGAIRGRFDGFGSWIGGGVNNQGLFTSHYNTPVFNTPRAGIWTSLLGPIWYWDVQNSGINNQPVGVKTFYMFYSNTGAPITCHLYGAVDDTLTGLIVNGVVTAPGTSMGFAATYQTNPFTIATGINVIVINVSNATGLAGFNLRLRNASNTDLMHPSMWYY